MTQAYRSTMNHSMQLTNAWLRQIDKTVSWGSSSRSLRCLRLSLRTIRDLLGVDEAEAAVGIIFNVLTARVPTGEIKDIRGSLRQSLCDM